MAFSIKFNEEKNQLLKATRGISFEDVRDAIEGNGLLANVAHPNSHRSNQHLYVVKIGNYAYVVPYVLNEQAKKIFLKTIYPSRKFTKIYVKKGDA